MSHVAGVQRSWIDDWRERLGRGCPECGARLDQGEVLRLGGLDTLAVTWACRAAAIVTRRPDGGELPAAGRGCPRALRKRLEALEPAPDPVLEIDAGPRRMWWQDV